MERLLKIELFSSYLIILATLVYFILVSSLFYLKHAKKFEQEYESLTGIEFNWLIWPAIGINHFFSRLFGESGRKFRDLYTFRSVSITFAISLFSNVLCVIFILISIPEDLPPFDLQIIRILVLSYMVFVVFNFFGDLISVNVTRYVISKIISGKVNIIKYLGIDLLGIIFGYFITFLPSVIIFLICWNSDIEFNQFVHLGLFGNALIPFFLFIFATTTMPLPFIIFAGIAVFSVTIPTFAYLALMVFCYTGYRIYSSVKVYEKINIVENIIKCALVITKFLMILAPMLMATAYLLKEII